jgi:4-hydroxy-tetrahydrodipicolinate synthase
MIFKGVGTALVTPFDDNDNIDFAVLKQMLEHQIESGINAIVIAGTTGEAPNLENDEFEELIKHTLRIVGKRVPVIVGTSSNNYKKCLHNSLTAKNLGADGLLICNPYYNKGTETGVYEFFNTIANEVCMPIVLYNVPSRTGSKISLNNVYRLSKNPYIIGIKEASGDLEYAKEIIKNTDDDFYLYSGNDDNINEIMDMGGNGLISVLSNALPLEVVQNLEEKTDKYKTLIKLLFQETNPTPIKKLMEILGYISMNLRLPMYEATEETEINLEEELEKLKSKKMK